MKDAAFGKLIRLRVHDVLHKPEHITCHAAPGVFRQRWLQRQIIAEAGVALLQMGVIEYLDKPAERLLALATDAGFGC